MSTNRLTFSSPDAMTPQARRRLQRQASIIDGALTPGLARAAAVDETNRQMRANGRAEWNEDNFNLACATFARLNGGV
jgi:hypothetical protein